MEERALNHFRGTCLSLLFALATATTISAQMTREQIMEEGKKHPPLPPPSNLQVLPKDMAIPDLIVTMVRVAEGLGVQCAYCHVLPEHAPPDFASDAKPEKVKARVMLRMVSDINGRYLAQLPQPHKAAEPVGCGTCHQGQAVPPAYKPPAGFTLQ
jgi:hypothetical protein